MKRTTGAIAVTGIAALLLSACGGGTDTPSTTPTQTTPAGNDTGTATSGGGDSATTTGGSDAETSTEAAAPPDTAASTEPPVRDASADLVIWSDDVRQPIVQEFADKFGQEQGIKVQVQVSTDVRQQFKDATNVGQGPDVIVGAHDWLGELVQNGTVAPIQMSEDVQAQFTPESLEATKFNGQIYGVPYATESLALVRNTDLAPDAPATMEDLVKTGKALVDDGKADQIMVTPVGQTGDAYHAFPWLSAYGGGIFGKNADGGWNADDVIVDSPETVKGGDKIKWLADQKALNVNIDGTTMGALFAEGKTPYMVTGPWTIDSVKDAGINYEVSPIPDFEDGGHPTPFLGVQMFYVSSKAKNGLLAQEFVNTYVTSPDMQKALFDAGNRPPALKSVLDEVAASDADIAAWSKAGEGAPPMPNIPAMNAVWGPLGQATSDIVGGDDPAKRLEAAQKEIVTNIAAN